MDRYRFWSKIKKVYEKVHWAVGIMFLVCFVMGSLVRRSSRDIFFLPLGISLGLFFIMIFPSIVISKAVDKYKDDRGKQ